jgi:uncharacterized protein YndB with AHSA1/START domain
MMTVTDTEIIRGKLDEVYSCFWNPTLWPRITPHVKKVEIIAWQGAHQQFRMCVEANGKQHWTESERDAVNGQRITYRQTKPPPFFLEHTGEWRFAQVGDGVRVTLIHRVCIDEERAQEMLSVGSHAEAKKLIRQTLKRNGSLTITAIKRMVEGDATTSSVAAELRS